MIKIRDQLICILFDKPFTASATSAQRHYAELVPWPTKTVLCNKILLHTISVKIVAFNLLHEIERRGHSKNWYITGCATT